MVVVGRFVINKPQREVQLRDFVAEKTGRARSRMKYGGQVLMHTRIHTIEV